MPSIQHVWSILCLHSVIDSESGNLTLFNTLEQLNISANTVFPLMLGASFELVTLWTRGNVAEPVIGRGKVHIIRPDGTEVQLVDSSLDLTTYIRLRQRTGIQGLEIPSVGRYLFRVTLNDEQEVALVPLDVVLIDETLAIETQ